MQQIINDLTKANKELLTSNLQMVKNMEQLISYIEDLRNQVGDLEERFDNTENDLTGSDKDNEAKILNLFLEVIKIKSNRCCICGENNENGLVEFEKGDMVVMCENCDIDGANYNGWDDENEHGPMCCCISDNNKVCNKCS